MNTKDLSSEVAASLEDLLQYYHDQAERCEDLRIGVEWERFGMYTADATLVPYLGEKGYLRILQFLHEEKGWKIEDGDGEYIFTLERDGARTTVEADGKPEISASPHASLHDVAAEITRHKQEIDEISEKLGIGWMAVGLQPLYKAEDIPLLPKKRYEMWDRIFPNHHEWMHTYMKALAGTHINFGYTSEKNLIRKTQVLLRLSPLLAAMFANSPYAEGKRTKCWGTRRHKIFEGGPGQEKMMSGMLSPDFSLEKWIEWYIDLPVILFQFDQNIEVPKGFTFRKWMNEGYEGRFPTFFDFDQHLKTRWTDVRFRPSYLELRVFDTLPYDLLMASAAFIKGIVFDSRGWESVEVITKNWTEDTIYKLHLQGCSESMNTKIEGRTFLDIARELMEVACENLKGYEKHNEKGEDECIFLAPLKRLLEKGISPAEDLVNFSGSNAQKIIEWSNKSF